MFFGLDNGGHLTGQRGNVYAVAFSHDGKLLVSAGGDPYGGDKKADLRLWDAKTLKSITTLEGHVDVITSIAFSPDDTQLLSGDHAGSVRLWKLREPKPPAPPKDNTERENREGAKP